MPIAIMKIEEINDRTNPQPIEDISKRAADHPADSDNF